MLKPSKESKIQNRERLLDIVNFTSGKVQRVNTRVLSGVEDIALQEVIGMDFSICPNCRTPILPPKWDKMDSMGGSGCFDYRIHTCEWCCWWTIFKMQVDCRAPDNIIRIHHVHPASRNYRSLESFNHYEEHPELQFLIRFLASQPKRLQELSWTAFQDLAQAYLLDQGMDVADISRIRSSGGDFLCVDANGNVIVVEVKHYTKRPVDVGTVWKVIGVVTSEGLDGGMVITSHRFSPDAITLMERGSIGSVTKREERRGMKHVGRRVLINWLKHVQYRDRHNMLEIIDDFLLQDTYDEGGA
jgi:RNase P subunit RPR2